MLTRFLAWAFPPKHPWMLTESNGPKNLYLPPCSEKAALKYLQTHFSNASVDLVDRELYVIFYRHGRKAST